MINLLSTVIFAAVLSTSNPVVVPNAPKVLTFDASAYVTNQNKIRLAIEKTSPEPVLIQLRNTKKEVLFQQVVGKREQKCAIKLDVNDLADGQYEIEIKSEAGSIRKQVNLVTPQLEHTIRTIVME
jgi:hypothetical protein